MSHLVRPTVTVRESFVAGMEEFRAEGRDRTQSMVGLDLRDCSGMWGTPEGFRSYVENLHAEALEETVRPDDWVPHTTLWWIDGADWIGRLSIRHRLTGWLEQVGGHIGYDVRASRRREGHATAMLRAALPVAHLLGISSALVTCDDDNLGSRKVIEACGGVLEDQRGNKLRYWVPTS